MNFLLHFIFPSNCLHCDETISRPPFCLNCTYYLSISSDSTMIFERNPVTDLYLKYVKKYQFISHIKTTAAFVVLKLIQLGWLFPEIITGSDDLTHKIAKEVSYFLNKRFQKKIKVKHGRVLQIKDLVDDKNNYSIFLLMM